mmetsp:Transcript_872/g.1793  ORF Transcript_872/g.1793 Transcript_872/m.1793 type:complete len:263 (+) Transcript_872:1788-2576(+)
MVMDHDNASRGRSSTLSGPLRSVFQYVNAYSRVQIKDSLGFRHVLQHFSPPEFELFSESIGSTRNQLIQFLSALAQEQSLPIVVQSSNDRIQQSLGNLCQFFTRLHQGSDVSKLPCEIHTESVHKFVVCIGLDSDFVCFVAGKIEFVPHHVDNDGSGRRRRGLHHPSCLHHVGCNKSDGRRNLIVGTSEESKDETRDSRRHVLVSGWYYIKPLSLNEAEKVGIDRSRASQQTTVSILIYSFSKFADIRKYPSAVLYRTVPRF